MKVKFERKQANLELPLLSVHEWPCADCGARLVLVLVNGQPVYQCEMKYSTGCKGIASAHPNGQPLGIPIDAEGRALRSLLHGLIDPYWVKQQDKKAARKQVYDFMHRQMGDTVVEHPDGSETIIFSFHVSYLLHEDLKHAIAIAQDELRKEFG